MDDHFDLPNAHDDTPEMYGLRLDAYDGQVMNMDVFDGNSRMALSLEEIRDAHKQYSERNPKGRYSIVPISDPCPVCNDTGEARVTREMALDAGDPELEGTLTSCCNRGRRD